MRVQWRTAAHFHEIAETLGVNTDNVLAASDLGGRWQAFYSTPADPELLWFVELARDGDGILVCCGAPIAKPGMWRDIVTRLEQLP